jgi:hypothetical protein
MKPRAQLIDVFQIVGFVVSIVISIGLIVIGQDTIPSVTLGLVLAILTQLFDMQMRQSSSEERILKAGLLNQSLYKDEWLLRQIQQIVDSYIIVKKTGFELFEIRAKDVVTECHNVLHGLADGYMIAAPRSPYSFGTKGISGAKKSVKAASIADFSYWKTNYAQSYLKANKDTLERGVKIIRVFIADRKTLESISDVLQTQKEMGIEVHTAVIDDIPNQLIEDTLIVDDKIFSRGELTSDGKLREIRLTIDAVEVQQAVTRFDALLRHSEKM